MGAKRPKRSYYKPFDMYPLLIVSIFLGAFRGGTMSKSSPHLPVMINPLKLKVKKKNKKIKKIEPGLMLLLGRTVARMREERTKLRGEGLVQEGGIAQASLPCPSEGGRPRPPERVRMTPENCRTSI